MGNGWQRSCTTQVAGSMSGQWLAEVMYYTSRGKHEWVMVGRDLLVPYSHCSALHHRNTDLRGDHKRNHQNLNTYL